MDTREKNQCMLCWPLATKSRLKTEPFVAPSPKSADELKRARSTDKRYTSLRNNGVPAKTNQCMLCWPLATKSRLKNEPFRVTGWKTKDEHKRANSRDSKYTNIGKQQTTSKNTLHAMLSSGDQKSVQNEDLWRHSAKDQ